MRLADRCAQSLARAERHAREDATHQQHVGAALMAEMIDRQTGDAREAPALRMQARSEVELLAAMQIAVGQVSDGLNGRTAIDASAVEPLHKPRTPVRIGAAGALDVFEALFLPFDNHAADARQIRDQLKLPDGRGEKRG